MKTTPDRFHRSRWSETRKQIDSMSVGDVLIFTRQEYFNAKSSVDRLNDAYEDRCWMISVRGGIKTRTAIVTRIK